MNGSMLLLPILVPALVGILCLLVPDRLRHAKEALTILAAAANLALAISF